MIPNGLQRLKKEDTDANAPYTCGAVLFGGSIPDKKERSYHFPPSWIIKQDIVEGGNDECAGCSLALVSGIQEQKQLDPHFHWMLARLRSNMGLNEYGCNLRDIAMTARNYGSLLKEDSPLDFKDGRDKIATPASWNTPELLKKSVYQKKGSILWVKAENGMDAYDMFRSSVISLNKKYGKTHGAVFGMVWNYALNQVYLDEVKEVGGGHAVALLDEWDLDHVTLVNSYGLEVGSGGEYQLGRTVFNHWAEVYGCFIPIDESAENLKWYIENGVKLDGNTYLNILRSLVNALKDLLAQLKAKTMGIFKEKQSSNVGGVMLWDTPAHIRYNVRVMCDNAGLSWATKNVICAIIKQESNWSTKAYNNRNSNGTADHGLLQINDHKGYHIGKGLYFASVEEVYANPEKSVRFVIAMAKAGRLNLWSSYKYKHYLKWLLAESVRAIPY